MGEWCQCGNAKYPDANTCEACARRGEAYDNPQSQTRCACGAAKYPDADVCTACWNRQHPYREGGR